MAQKNVTNHQLGIVLAELMQGHMQKIGLVVGEVKEAERQIQLQVQKLGEIEQNIAHQLEHTTLKIDLRPLESINEVIQNSANSAKEDVKGLFTENRLIKFVVLTPAVCILVLALAVFFFFKAYEGVAKEKIRMENYNRRTSEYFQQNPKEQEKFEKWNDVQNESNK